MSAITELHEVWKSDGYGTRVVARFVDKAEADMASDAIKDDETDSFVAPLPVDDFQTFMASCAVRTHSEQKH
jgi:hypothetical protein